MSGSVVPADVGWIGGRSAVWCLAAAMLLSGCAARRPATLADQFIKGQPVADETRARSGSAPLADAAALAHPPQENLASYIAKVRHLSTATRPTGESALATGTVEGTDRGILIAKMLVEASPTASNHDRLAEAYRRRGILDLAAREYNIALRLNPTDAVAYDGRARIWRNWGFADLALADAFRAVQYAPSSAAAYNTLGTLLQLVGRRHDAQAAYERALALEPGATYALSNLCYLALIEGQGHTAVTHCERARSAQPMLAAVENNLGLAYAAVGDLERAGAAFAHAGDAATVQYNLGIVLLATRRFPEAARAFDEASRLRPSLPHASERAAQARRLAAAVVAENPDARE